MPNLAKIHTFKRKVTLFHIGPAGEEVDFLITFTALEDIELAKLTEEWPYVPLPDGSHAAEQKAWLEKIIASVECPKYFDTPEAAKDYIVDGLFDVKSAVRAFYTNHMYQGGLLQKN